jgi:hypothetical protein
MHSQPKIFEAELAEVLPGNCKRIEVVLFEISPKLPLPFLVFSPQKTEAQKEQRYDDGRDDIDCELALESINHSANIFFAAVATGLRTVSSGVPRKWITEPWLQTVLPPSCTIITDFQPNWRV